MKNIMIIIGLILISASASHAQDVREAVRKAQGDRATALQRAQEVEEEILNDKQALAAEVEKYEILRSGLERELDDLVRKVQANEQRREALENDWAKQEMEFNEISGNVRVAARDFEEMLAASPLTALHPERIERIAPLLDKGYFPGLDDIGAMTSMYFDEIMWSGEVRLQEGGYVGRDGETVRGMVMILGTFTAVYHNDSETGFLIYSPQSKNLFALSTLPPLRIRKALERYLSGKSEVVPFDMSGGAALRQITRKESFSEHWRAGGPVMWPIGATAIFALLIVISRFIFLNRVARNTGTYMTRVNRLASEGKWDECEAIVKRHKGEHSPVNHVIEAGLQARNEDRETLENVLQEAILRELPRVERGLSVLSILGAIAPLLGLLGTVTGMINTFNVITLFGNADPKLMSGGISEALITTEVGLIVAIPVMLLHTLLSRRVEFIIGEMEEKAVSLTNIIQRERSRNGDSPVSPASGTATLALETI